MEGFSNSPIMPEKNSLQEIPIFKVEMYEVPGHEKITTHSIERYLNDKKQDSFIKEIAEHSPFVVKQKIINGEKVDILAALREGVKNADLEIKKIFIETANKYAQPDERDVVKKEIAQMIRDGMFSGDEKTQKMCAELIYCAPKNETADIIQMGIQTGNLEIIKKCSDALYSVSKEKRPDIERKISEIVQAGFKSEDIEKQRLCSKMIWELPDKRELQEKLVPIIQHALTSKDTSDLKKCAEMIRYAPLQKMVDFQNELAQKVREGLSTEDVETQIAYIEMMKFLPEDERMKLMSIISDKELGNIFVESPLYKNKGVIKEKFSRTNFVKNGSELVLQGGNLKDKLVHRRIDPFAFLTWQQAYENYQSWEDAGFDYVPVEPIASFGIGANNLVDVYSGVLDLSFQTWLDRTGGIFKKELVADRNAILKVLKEQKIEHGHPHDENFCLRFYRDQNGIVDLKRKPRIYLIDFDQSSHI